MQGGGRLGRHRGRWLGLRKAFIDFFVRPSLLTPFGLRITHGDMSNPPLLLPLTLSRPASSVGAWLSWLIMLCAGSMASSSRRASPSGVLRSLRYAQKKKKNAFSLSLSLSVGNTPTFSRMSAPMPRGSPNPSVRGFNVLSNALSNPRSL